MRVNIYICMNQNQVITYIYIAMKRFIIFISILSLIVFTGCDKDDNTDPIVETDNDIRISAVYTTKENPNKEFVDFGSKIYIYYEAEIYGSLYEGNGKFINNNKVFTPAQTAEIDMTGITVITPKYIDKQITIVIESAYYNRLSIDSHLSAKRPISIKLITKP